VSALSPNASIAKKKKKKVLSTHLSIKGQSSVKVLSSNPSTIRKEKKKDLKSGLGGMGMYTLRCRRIWEQSQKTVSKEVS
jgi:hypothetical protein